MTLSTAQTKIPPKKDPENQSYLTKSDPFYDEPSLTRSLKILSDEISSFSPNRLASRLIQIKFYDPQNALLSFTDEVFLTCGIQLKELIPKLQDSLDSGLMTEKRESLRVNSVQISILGELFESFPWLSTNLEDTHEDPVILPENSIRSNMAGKMTAYWTMFRDFLLLDDHETTQKHGTPTLKVRTVLSETKLNESQVSVIANDTHKLSNNASEVSSPVDEQDIFKIKTVAKSQISASDNQEVISKFQDGWTSLPDTEQEPFRSQQQKNANYVQTEETVKGNNTAKLEPVIRDYVECNDSKNQQNKKNISPDLFLEQFVGLKRTWPECGQPSKPFTIYNVKNWGREEQLNRKNEGLSLSVGYLNRVDTMKSYWHSYENLINDGLSTKIADLNHKESLCKEEKIEDIDPQLTKDLEKYRKMHESAISYADEDGEAFFPSTPKLEKTIKTTAKNLTISNERRQMTQLDLDKIVNDALKRKKNKSKNVHPYSPLNSPNINCYNGMTNNQLNFPSPKLSQNLNNFHEHVDNMLPENIYTREFCGSGDINLESYRQLYPASYNMVHLGQGHERMSHFDPELIPVITLNSPRAQNIDTIDFMNPNLHHIDNTMMGHIINNHNMTNFLDNTHRYYSGPKDIRPHFTGNDCQFDADNTNFYFAHALNNQMHTRNVLM